MNLIVQPERAFHPVWLGFCNGSPENLAAQFVVAPDFRFGRFCLCDYWRMLQNERLAWVVRKQHVVVSESESLSVDVRVQRDGILRGLNIQLTLREKSVGHNPMKPVLVPVLLRRTGLVVLPHFSSPISRSHEQIQIVAVFLVRGIQEDVALLNFSLDRCDCREPILNITLFDLRERKEDHHVPRIDLVPNIGTAYAPRKGSVQVAAAEERRVIAVVIGPLSFSQGGVERGERFGTTADLLISYSQTNRDTSRQTVG